MINPFEDMLINMGLSAVRVAIKNPTHAAKLKDQLITIANDIYMTYGLTPPSDTSTATP